MALDELEMHSIATSQSAGSRPSSSLASASTRSQAGMPRKLCLRISEAASPLRCHCFCASAFCSAVGSRWSTSRPTAALPIVRWRWVMPAGVSGAERAGRDRGRGRSGLLGSVLAYALHGATLAACRRAV